MKSIHGHSGRIASRTYNSWRCMKSRCLYAGDKEYKNYAARGITVTPAWMSFVNFLDDMGEKPPGMQLDRIDNNRGYSKDNCRWTTPGNNTNNRRNTPMITIEGETKALTEWARQYNIRQDTLTQRIKRGWSGVKLLQNPRLYHG